MLCAEHTMLAASATSEVPSHNSPSSVVPALLFHQCLGIASHKHCSVQWLSRPPWNSGAPSKWVSIMNGQGASCHLSWLYVCSLHVPAVLKSFSTAFSFPFLENISPWKLTWNLERMNTVAFQQWDALCPQEKGDRTEGLILSDEVSVFPWIQKDHAACEHLGSYDESALQAWDQPVKSTSWMMALL